MIYASVGLNTVSELLNIVALITTNVISNNNTSINIADTLINAVPDRIYR